MLPIIVSGISSRVVVTKLNRRWENSPRPHFDFGNRSYHTIALHFTWRNDRPMTRAEYMQKMSESRQADKPDSDRQSIHHQYYFGFARVARMFLPDYLKKMILKSVDEHFNDIPLHIWDNISLCFKMDICRANLKINGTHSWSLCDGVCALKALARQYKDCQGQAFMEVT